MASFPIDVTRATYLLTSQRANEAFIGAVANRGIYLSLRPYRCRLRAYSLTSQRANEAFTWGSRESRNLLCRRADLRTPRALPARLPKQR